MDNIQGIDPKYLALIQAGMGILAANNGRQPAGAAIGQGLLGGTNAYQENLMQQQMMKRQQQMLDMQNEQFGWQKEKRDAEKAQNEQQKMLLGNIAKDYGLDPNVLSAYPSIGENVIKNKLIPKDPELLIAPNGVAINKNDPSNIGKTFIKPEDSEQNPNRPFMMVNGQIVPNKAYQDYEIAKQRAGASSNNISVNTGQKGFDNTLKLRGDFRSEPIYKAHNEVQSAYSQIKAALKQASPAGDLAGATKIMKILDPGSVVRESELGMAMAASGALDRLTNYADMTIKGTKLTPTQRKDFQALADSLYKESVNQYNEKREEYKGIANRNELNELDVLGNEAKIIQEKPPATAKQTAPVKIKNDADFNKLPSGTVFIDPFGKKRIKP